MDLRRFWRNSGAIGSNVGLDDEHPGGSLADGDAIQKEMRGRRQPGHGRTICQFADPLATLNFTHT